ncbi:hypothetical protein Hanom_Chr00s000002g01599381 [Helianthus anomalus]
MPHSLCVIATSSVSLFMAITAIVVIIMDSTIHFSSSYSLYLIKSKLRLGGAPMVWLVLQWCGCRPLCRC